MTIITTQDEHGTVEVFEFHMLTLRETQIVADGLRRDTQLLVTVSQS